MNRNTSIAYALILSGSLLALASCSGTKGLADPDLEMPSAYMDSPSADSLSLADIEWWEFFTDEPLRAIITTTLENNRDMLKAQARVEEMRALYGIDKANMLPEVSATIAADRETENYSGKGSSTDHEYDLKVSVGWELNLWGALTWARRQGQAKYIASVEDMRAMRMTLIAETASAYFRLIALDNELDIVKQTLKTRDEALEQARIRFEGGLTSETVYQQAKVEYATTAALVPGLESAVSKARNALSLLMGEYPGNEITRSALTLYDNLPDRLPVGVPSDLLKRRPDLRVAEQNLKASMAAVGIAYANRFPSLKIALSAGLEDDELPSFFKSPWSYVSGAITGPVVDFGRRKKKYEASKAVYNQARFAYEKAVMGAFAEVSDAVVGYRNAHQAAILKSELCDAAVKYVQLAHVQYRGGSLNYINVLDAQRRYFDARIGLSNAIRDEYLAIVGLYKALGGGLGMPKTAN